MKEFRVIYKILRENHLKNYRNGYCKNKTANCNALILAYLSSVPYKNPYKINNL